MRGRFLSTSAILAAVYLLTRVPFVYRAGFPDADLHHMTLGIVDAVGSQTYFLGARLYAVATSLGYYVLWFALAPLYRDDAHLLVLLVNLLGMGAGMVGLLAFWWILRIAFGDAVGVAGSTLLLLMPGFWELTTYGHPTVVATGAALASLALFARALRAEGRPAWPWWAASTVLYAFAVLVRVDSAALAPAFPALAMVLRKPVRSVLLSSMSLIGVAALLWLVAHHFALPPHSTGGLDQTISRVLSVPSGSGPVAVKELAILVFGLGMATAAAALAGTVWAWRRGLRRALLPTAAVALPGLVWWLSIEGPFRHLLGIAVFLLIPAALPAMRMSRGKAAALALGIAAANQAIAAASFGFVERSYPWAYQSVPGIRRWTERVPLGDWFSNHGAAAASVSRKARHDRWFASLDEPRVLVVSPSSYSTELEVLQSSSAYRYSSWVERGAIWIRLETPKGVRLFLESEPGPTRDALLRATSAGQLTGFAFYVPDDARPTTPLPIRPGQKILEPAE